MKCSFKFFPLGWYNLPNTKKGKQLSRDWINNALDKMIASTNSELRSTANLIRNYVAKKIVRVKLNMFNPKGINRWNTFDSFILKSRGKY